MTNKVLACIGVAVYGLEVIASASDANGNNITPTYLLLVSSAASLFFLIFAAIRLWSSMKKTTVLFVATRLLTGIVPFFLTAQNSSVNLIISFVGIGAFLVYFYVIFLLYNLPKKP